MKSEFILTLSRELSNRNFYPAGCSKKEIENLEIYAKHSLPETYKDFMISMGRNGGNYLDDINSTYGKVFDNRDIATELLKEDESDFRISETDFVFSSYLGGQFMFFNLLEGNNPPVYYYNEGTIRIPVETYERFTECILKMF